MVRKKKLDYSTLLSNEFKKRNNPTDFKEGIFATVTQIEPVVLACENAQIQLTEGDNLYISEWFRLRCNIDKTTALSEGVPSDLEAGKAVTETHSYTPNNPCNMPSAIADLANAITKINTEILQLKCDLKIGDKVVVLPLDIDSKYILIDKILTDG